MGIILETNPILWSSYTKRNNERRKMEQKSRETETEDQVNEKIAEFVKNDVFEVLKKGTKASEREAGRLIDEFIKKWD